MKIQHVIVICLGGVGPLFASSGTWNAMTPGSDLNTAANWSPTTVPTTTANFDSTVSDIDTSPVATADFTIENISFLNAASPFSYTFTNAGLVFNGTVAGINGGNTDAAFQANNTNENLSSSNQFNFNGASLNTSASAFLSANNVGTASGTGTSLQNGVLNSQIISSSSSVPFNIGMGGSLSAYNSGLDSTTGAGNNAVGYLNGYQISFMGPFSGEESNSIICSNVGTITGSSHGNAVGYIKEGQLYAIDMSLGNNAVINLYNSGSDTSSGSNGFSAYVELADQLHIENNFTTGDNLQITAINAGTNAGNGSNRTVGSLARKTLFIGNQMNIGNNANILLYNSGTDTGTGTDNEIAQQSSQLSVNGNFIAGDNLTLYTSNIGSNTEGDSSAAVANVYNSQIQIIGNFTTGNNAIITMYNSGTQGLDGTYNNVGYVYGSQFYATADFTAGKNMTMTATNVASDASDSSSNNLVGYIDATAQIDFKGSCIIGDGSTISAINHGTVAGGQIIFSEGFTVSSGKATIQAVNTGALASPNISITDSITSGGGNVNIMLSNASLNVNTSLSQFQVGELNGDSSSTVQSLPEFVINTDADVNAVFAGVMEDFNFPSQVSSLLIDGSGVQTFSGANTFTGMTSVQGGTFILNGSIAGSAKVFSGGILKGTGSIAGTLTNMGRVAPGQSIGTLTVGTFINSGGTYDLELNSNESDLILVTNNAIINGGNLIISSDDGTYAYQTPYTIIQAGGAVSGAFDFVNAVSSMIVPSVTYSNQEVYLTLTTNIGNAAITQNQINVAAELDGIINPTPSQSALLDEIVTLSLPVAADALQSLSGQQFTGELAATELSNHLFIRRLYDPLRSLVTNDCYMSTCFYPCYEGFSLWCEGGDGIAHLNSDFNASGFNLKSYEVTLGIQKTGEYNGWTLGGALSYESGMLHYRSGNGSERLNTVLGGIYVLYRPICYYGILDLAFGYSANSMHREIHVGAETYYAKSKPKISEFTLYGEMGEDFYMSCVLIQPFIGLELATSWRNTLTESGGSGWNLSVKDKSHFKGSSRIGAHVSSSEMFSCFNVSLDLAWDCCFSSKYSSQNTEFVDFGEAFDVYGVVVNRNSLDYSLAVSTNLSDEWQFYVEGMGQHWNRLDVNHVVAGFDYRW